VAVEQRRECPLCGESMRRVERESIDLLPGTGEVKRMTTREWVCPECDYFEEVEAETRPRSEDPGSGGYR
jgi:acetone carboxylase gamma subunit